MLDHPQYKFIEDFAKAHSLEINNYLEEHKTYKSYSSTKRISLKTTHRNWDLFYLYSDNSFEQVRSYSGIFVPVYNNYDLEFSFRKADGFDKIMRRFNKSFVKVGDSEIDNAYLIKSNETSFLNSVIKIKALRKFLLENKQFFFELKNYSTFFYKSKGEHLSYIGLEIINDWLTDEKLLLEMLCVMKEVLDGMFAAGIISDKKMKVD
ncbi:MAG: hypothetical protein K9J13_13165 [Saprospiraceae bacterium]|nr:hypothetical protein [Saprospiraceae bacterium]